MVVLLVLLSSFWWRRQEQHQGEVDDAARDHANRWLGVLAIGYHAQHQEAYHDALSEDDDDKERSAMIALKTQECCSTFKNKKPNFITLTSSIMLLFILDKSYFRWNNLLLTPTARGCCFY
jgi:hypothetical protein